MAGEAVDHEGVAEQVEVLALVAEAVGAAEPKAVVESAVDGFGVVASLVEVLEVGVVGGDGPNVLSPIELPSSIVVVAVQADAHGSGAVAIR